MGGVGGATLGHLRCIIVSLSPVSDPMLNYWKLIQETWLSFKLWQGARGSCYFKKRVQEVKPGAWGCNRGAQVGTYAKGKPLRVAVLSGDVQIS